MEKRMCVSMLHTVQIAVWLFVCTKNAGCMEIDMLKHIVLFITNFTEAEEGIVACLRDLRRHGLTVFAPQSEQKLEEYLNRAGDTCVLITDVSSFSFSIEKVAVLGYGEQYRGTAPYVVYELQNVSVDYVSLVYDRKWKLPHTIATTKRLLIREMTLTDLDALYTLYATLADCPYVEPLYEREQEAAFTQNYIAHMYRFFAHGLWLVFEKDTGVLVGRMGIENREIDGETKKELGYLIRKDKQGQGYAKEAASAILTYAKEELGIEELFVYTSKKNIPSRTLAEKLGFQFYTACDNGMLFYQKEL